MVSDFINGISLKIKVALAASALFVLFVATAAYFTLSYFGRTFKETVSGQQFSQVSNLANSIDDKLRISQNALIAVAAIAPDDVFTNADHAQRFLDSKAGLLSIFDNGIFFISKDGILIAESPYRPDRRGKNLSFREWVQQTVTGRKPYISEPYISTHTPGQPAIVMTVPIFDRQGRLSGMMTGSLDLLGENFLASLSRIRIGTGGYFFVSDKKRTMIVHPDKGRIMKPAAQPGVNKLYDRVINGFEGSGETVNSSGVAMLSSGKHLRMTPWVMVATSPTDEVYGSLYKARYYFVIATVTGTALLLLTIWLVMRRLMSPLAVVTRHVEQLQQKTGGDRLIAVDSADEIGILATAFNAMIGTLDKQTMVLEHEIVERQTAQEALAAKQRQLEALNEFLEKRVSEAVAELRQKDQILIQQSRQASMGEMINSIAHQWRQPLNNLGLIVQNLKITFESGNLSEDEMTSEVGKAMDTIISMSRTIDDFRNFFRTDKQKRPFSLNAVVGKSIEFLSASLSNANIAIDFEAEDFITVVGYPNEYSQAMLNILSNSKDVLAEHQVVSPHIRVRIFRERGAAVVTVWDNGGGIDEQVLPRIFDPYFSTKEQGKGTGIGLYMSKVIIEKNMGGNIAAYNIDGGVEFRIELQPVEDFPVPSC
jgi:signal transduction histidine kinase